MILQALTDLLRTRGHPIWEDSNQIGFSRIGRKSGYDYTWIHIDQDSLVFTHRFKRVALIPLRDLSETTFLAAVAQLDKRCWSDS